MQVNKFVPDLLAAYVEAAGENSQDYSPRKPWDARSEFRQKYWNEIEQRTRRGLLKPTPPSLGELLELMKGEAREEGEWCGLKANHPLT